MSRLGRRVSAIATGLLTAGLLAGCLSMPDSGPVHETQSEGGVSADPGTFINPRPPQAGDTRADIVRGFLVAMTATPIQTNTAREFLTDDAAAAWTPEDETITYDGYPRVDESATGVSVTLADPDRLDAQGAWQGPLPRPRRTVGFPMAFEDGEWRIDQAPDALIVPEAWFARRFQQVSLYFFDPTAGTLVPEPVYVPGGNQLASTLTQALLLGPGEGLNRVVKSYLPPGLTVNLSVPISEDGIADIGLKGDAGQLSPEVIELMMAQLAWTLHQDQRITALRVSINGTQVPLPGGAASYRIDGGANFDPVGFRASSLLYGLRDGLLASGSRGSIEPVSGPLGQAALGLRSVGVSLTASEAAGVTLDGRSVFVGPVSGKKGDKARPVVEGARNLLAPGWDFADRMWLVDSTSAGAVISSVQADRQRVLDVPGITGQQVRSFLVSRDGTRLVAVVRRPDGDQILVSRIAHSRSGRVLWATPARAISGAPDSDLPVRAIAWSSPTSLGVLSPFAGTDSLVQLRTASIDGSPASEGIPTTTVEGGLRALAGSPVPDQALYGLTGRALVDLSSADRRVVRLADGTSALTYVG
jgi:hypothetical protein